MSNHIPLQYLINALDAAVSQSMTTTLTVVSENEPTLTNHVHLKNAQEKKNDKNDGNELQVVAAGRDRFHGPHWRKRRGQHPTSQENQE